MHQKLTNNYFPVIVHLSVLQKSSEEGSEKGPVPTGTEDVQAAQGSGLKKRLPGVLNVSRFKHPLLHVVWQKYVMGYSIEYESKPF